MSTHARRALVRPLVRPLVLLALFAFALPCAAQEQASAPYRIAYTLSMPRPETHLFEVRVEVDGVGGASHVDFQMPRWSPGRYAVFDFAKNVQEFSAENFCGGATCVLTDLPVTRLDTQTWRVGTLGGMTTHVRVRYKVFADDLSGTFSQ
ncbi:MAG TPA: hypothetical protein VF064_08590, partial [Pyrinomonadaceae bacterium]